MRPNTQEDFDDLINNDVHDVLYIGTQPLLSDNMANDGNYKMAKYGNYKIKAWTPSTARKVKPEAFS